MSHFFENKDIYLRALEPEDLEIIYTWENDTELWKNGASINPFSRFAIRHYLTDSLQDIYQTKQLRMMVVEKMSHTGVGTVDLYDFDALHRRAGIGILIDKRFREKGYAVQALACIEKYAFNHLKLHQLYAFVPQPNTTSVTLFTRADYEETARLRDWISGENGFDNVIVMQKMNPN